MSPKSDTPPADEPTAAGDAPETPLDEPEAQEAPDAPAEPFEYEKHAPTTAPGTEMPDLLAATPEDERPVVTVPVDPGLGHAGIEGSPGYAVEIDKPGQAAVASAEKQAEAEQS